MRPSSTLITIAALAAKSFGDPDNIPTLQDYVSAIDLGQSRRSGMSTPSDVQGFKAKMVAMDELTAAEAFANAEARRRAEAAAEPGPTMSIKEAIDTVILNAPEGSNVARHIKRKAQKRAARTGRTWARERGRFIRNTGGAL